MNLHEALGAKLKEACKEMVHIHSLIRKHHSLKAKLQYNKVNASKDLDNYVEEMYGHLKKFRY